MDYTSGVFTRSDIQTRSSGSELSSFSAICSTSGGLLSKDKSGACGKSRNPLDLEKSAKYTFDLQTPHLESTVASNSLASSLKSGLQNTASLRMVTSSDGSVPPSVRRMQARTPRSGGSNRVPGSLRTPRVAATPMNFQPSTVVALVEGRGFAKGEIGMASIDLKGSELILSQFSDSPTYVKALNKLQILQPIEIVMPSTACEGGKMTSLFEIITEQFPQTSLTTVQRKYFNESAGLQYIKQLCVPEYTAVEMDVQNKYYCLATAAALLKYIEFIQNIVYAPCSLKIVFKGGERTTLIDASAAQNLELLQNSRDPKSGHCLFGVLNHTKTAGGARLLRSTILQPPCDLTTISTRLDCVEELTENEDLFTSFQSVLGLFLDVEHLISLCIQIPKKEGLKVFEQRISQIIYLKHTLELVHALQTALKGGENSLFKAYVQSLEDPRYDQILESIKTVVADETRYQKGTLNMKTQKLFAIKHGVNGLLDVARRTHCEVVEDIQALVVQEAERLGLPLTASYNTTRGFHIQISSSGQHDELTKALPSSFIKVVKSKSSISCTTEELIKLNTRVEESLEEVYLLSNIVISELLQTIRSQIGCLYKLAECVSLLDVLVSFAHLCTVAEYVRPEFTDTLAIKQGRHPILDKILPSGPPVANDTYASDIANFVVITGPNMSGKSTYLRQIALCQVMAQCGSFVPAEYASFRIASQIFLRVGSDDDLETNSSTFMMEMKEMNYIIQNLSDNSLVIIDELGRGTSVEEGVGLAHSICEHLLQKKAFTFFATHFHELCKLESLYPNVENYHLEVQRIFNPESRAEKIQFNHILMKGRTRESNYGLLLAEMSTLPEAITGRAKLLAEVIQRNVERTKCTTKQSGKEKATFRLAQRLLQAAKNSRLDDEALRIYLQGVRRQYDAEIMPCEE